jgi:hypothetical protein
LITTAYVILSLVLFNYLQRRLSGQCHLER